VRFWDLGALGLVWALIHRGDGGSGGGELEPEPLVYQFRGIGEGGKMSRNGGEFCSGGMDD